MPLPALQKTWQFNVNQRVPASGNYTTDYKNLLLLIKNSMIGFPQNPWVVVGSSDAVTAGMDGVDRWTDASKIVWAQGNPGGPRSWIVLRQTNLLSAFEFCISCTEQSGYGGRIMEFIQSPIHGFSGGSINIRPLDTPGAIDGETWTRNGWSNYGFWFYYYSSTFAPVVHAMQSSDGQCTRLICCSDGKSRTLFLFDRLFNPSPTMTYPAVWTTQGWTSDASYMTYGEMNAWRTVNAQYNNSMKTWPEGSPDYWPGAYLTSEGYADGALGNKPAGQVANDITGEWPLSPVGFATDLKTQNRMGHLVDIWWGSTALADATTYPSNGSKQRAQFGHLVFPWNGSTPLLT